MNQQNPDFSTSFGVALIDFYRAVSSCFPARCRYVPSCSEYARQAVLEGGLFKGALMAARRIIRCHPFGGHGYDPVPSSHFPCKKI